MVTEPFKTAPLSPSCLYMAEYNRTIWRVKVPDTAPVDALLQANYWAHTASRFRPMDIIEAFAEDGSWFAEYIVVDCAATWAKLELKYPVLHLHQRIESDEVPEGYEVAWKGPMLKFCVTRKFDNQRIYDKAPDKASALAWLRGHLKRVA